MGFLIYANNFLKLYTHMSLYNAMAAYAVFSDSHKYFTLAAIFVQM